MVTVSGGGKFNALLGKLRRTPPKKEVSVGFLAGGTYPGGESLPTVATVNEYGAPSRGQPPRPFFRNAIAKNKGSWPAAVALNMKATNLDVDKTLDRMGQGIKGQVQQSIRDLTDPPLSPKTIKRKGFDKPLIDTSFMVNHVDYRVDG